MLLRHEAFRRLCQARDLLAEPGDGDQLLTISEIARTAGVSPYYFIRQFEAVFGVTPHRYRIRQRMDLAKRLLAKGEHTVTEVCMEVGMSSLGSFSDLFAREVGVPPSAYQRAASRILVTVPGTLPQALFPGCLSLMGALPKDAFRSTRLSA